MRLNAGGVHPLRIASVRRRAKAKPQSRGSHSGWYVNYRILTDQGVRVEPPVKGENVLNSYVAHLKQIQNPRTPIEERALHLSWVFHQVGDIHQPLHAVARFSKALPEGDRGGNEVHMPNPRGRGGRGNNLHAYWDDLLGTTEDPGHIEKLAENLILEYPRAGFADELTKTNVRDWAEESVKISIKTVYNNLDPETTSFADVPVGHEADTTRAARRRAALAGCRLANEFEEIVASKR